VKSPLVPLLQSGKLVRGGRVKGRKTTFSLYKREIERDLTRGDVNKDGYKKSSRIIKTGIR
jgi:hypothetical protein